MELARPHSRDPGRRRERRRSFLVSPGLGLMIWTLVLFLITMWVLSKVAFPKIQEALDKRAKTIAESIDAAERQRKESDELLEEYRGRLAEAREQADDIMARARKAAETAEAEATAAGREKRDELVAQAQRDIEAETRRSLEQIRKEVADLTVLATEKVTRKTLTDDGPETARRGGPRRGRLLRPLGLGELGGLAWPTPPASTPRPSSRRARTKASSTSCRSSSAQFADAVDGDRELQVFLFSPYLSSHDKREGLRRADHGRRAGVRQLPRAAGRESTGCRRSSASGASSTSSGRRRTAASTSPSPAPSSSTPAWSGRSARRSNARPARRSSCRAEVDDEILGGIVLQVGNMVLDASIRTRLEKLRKSVASAA